MSVHSSYNSIYSQGSFTIELYHKHAPVSCQNIAELARIGYYDATIFHRVIKDFMAQCGDPTGTGRGGESIYGYTSCIITANNYHIILLTFPSIYEFLVENLRMRYPGI